jgi:hypothetical protein
MAITAATVACLAFVNVFAESPRTETIPGRIVAFANGLTCLNGNAYWSMLVHVQDDKSVSSPKFIQVRFSLPCNEKPEWLNHKSFIQKFRLKRDAGADSVLKNLITVLMTRPGTANLCPSGSSCLERKTRSSRLVSQCRAIVPSVCLLPLSFDAGKLETTYLGRSMSVMAMLRQAFTQACAFVSPFICQPQVCPTFQRGANADHERPTTR